MINNLYRLGRALLNDPKSEYDNFFMPWQNPFPYIKDDLAKIVYFNIQDGLVEPTVEQESFKPRKTKHYLYRPSKGARGTNLVPTYYFYPSSKPEEHEENLRKLMDRVRRTIPDGASKYFSSTEEKENGLAVMENALSAFQPGKDHRYLFTLKVNGHWLGEDEDNIRLFESEAYDKYHDKSKADDKLCAVTYEQSAEVWGRIDTLGFTVNDPTFSRGGFDPQDSYKMFPVSPEAVKILEGARIFALEKLSRKFYELDYWVVPHFIEGGDDLMRGAVRVIAESETTSLMDQSRSLISGERVFADLLDEHELSSAGALYDILFYQKNKAQFAVKLHVQDVTPSRLSTIFQVKQLIEKRYGYICATVDKDKNPVRYDLTFADVRTFFTIKSGRDTLYPPFFYQLIEAIFYGQPVSSAAVTSVLIDKIRLDFKQRRESPTRFIYRTKRAFALWHFFYQLQLFSDQTTSPMESKSIALDLDSFVQQHPEFFRHPYQRAAFLLGCLLELLTEAQDRKLGSRPFLEKLSGLNLDSTELRKLFPKLKDKMYQYDDILKYKRKYIETLEQQIVPILLNETDLGRSEISFAFTCGMVMQKEFTRQDRETRKQKDAQTFTETEPTDVEA